MTNPMTPTLLPLSAIDATALPRDRSARDPEALDALQRSILTEGLRQPIEVFRLADPEPPIAYALISGLRRLTVFRTLAEIFPARFAEIPARICQPASIPAALAAMVSENEVRAAITPWEKASLILTCVADGHFETPDAAITGLFPYLSSQNRSRLRHFVEVVHHLDGRFTTPEALTTRQMERLSVALRAGLIELIEATLAAHARESLATQWQALTPVLAEALREDDPHAPAVPGRPRRVLRLRQGLTIRRELSRDGWVLRFSGPEARKGGLLDDVMDMVERQFQPRG